MSSEDYSREVILCECGSPEHQIIFNYIKDENPHEDYYSVQIHLSPTSGLKFTDDSKLTQFKNLIFRINFIWRLYNGFKYILGFKINTWEEVLISPQDVSKILPHLIEYNSRYKDTIEPKNIKWSDNEIVDDLKNNRIE